MTPHDLITLALKDAGAVGVGQTPLAEDANDALLRLNMMLAQWNRKRWLIYHLRDIGFSPIGATSYTIGTGPLASIDVGGRITGLETAYYRLPGGGEQGADFTTDFSADFGPLHVISPGSVDVPLTVLRSREDYSRIGMKGIGSFPAAVWLDADYPVGNLYVYPSVTGGEIHLVVQQILSAFPDLTTAIALPDEYQEALLYNLVARLRTAYGKPPRADVVALAKASLNTIRNANGQVATLMMPSGLPGGRGGGDMNSFWAGGGVAAAPQIIDRPVNVPVLVPAPGGGGPVVVDVQQF